MYNWENSGFVVDEMARRGYELLLSAPVADMPWQAKFFKLGHRHYGRGSSAEEAIFSAAEKELKDASV